MSGCYPRASCTCKCHVSQNYCCENCSINDNFILSKRIEKLEEAHDVFNKHVKSLTDMYKHLSISIACYTDDKVRQMNENIKIKKRLDDLEELIYEVKDKLRNCNKKPYECPVCWGKGFKEDQFMKRHDCNSCKNEGIVWG
jgi:hypothetical protein